MQLLRRIYCLWIPSKAEKTQAPLWLTRYAGSVHPSSLVSKMKVSGSIDSYVEVGQNSHIQCQVYFYKRGQLKIGALSYIGSETELHITDAITIGENVLISSSCILIDTDMHSLVFDKRRDDILLDINNKSDQKKWSDIQSAPIIIEDKAWIGLRSVILKGVTIGEGAIVGAGSVVTKNVPPWVIVAGNPARIVKKIENLQSKKQ